MTTGVVPVIVKDGVESVSDGEDSTVLELCADGVLDEVIGGHIDRRRGFVEHQDTGLPE